MIKSTKKEVKESIRAYILASLDGEPVDDLIASFNECAKYDATITSLAEFLTNNYCVFAIYTDEKRDLLGEWLQETEEEKSKYNEEQVEKWFFGLIDREIEKTLNIARGVRSDFRGVIHSGKYYPVYTKNN